MTITTASAQSITIGSGYSRIIVRNEGPADIYWGDTAVLMSSGNSLLPGRGFEWQGVEDAFTVYFRADSRNAVTADVSVTEF